MKISLKRCAIIFVSVALLLLSVVLTTAQKAAKIVAVEQLPQVTTGKAAVARKSASGKEAKGQEKPGGLSLKRREAATAGARKERADSSNGAAQAGGDEPTQSAIGQCSYTVLLVDEVGEFHLDSVGVPCLGCRISTDISQTVPGVLGFSNNPNGPWSETLVVYTNINFQGYGTSDPFYVKGVTIGTTLFEASNFWSYTAADFEVKVCACPDIPLIP